MLQTPSPVTECAIQEGGVFWSILDPRGLREALFCGALDMLVISLTLYKGMFVLYV